MSTLSSSSSPSHPPQPYNYSYHAIPLAFAHALLPHTYYLTRLMHATHNRLSTAMPRTNLSTWKTQLPPRLWAHLARARGAHLNSMEVFPLFAAAMVGGNVVGMEAGEMNRVAVGWFVARTVYLGLYLGVRRDGLAVARTGAYVWSVGIPVWALWRMGRVAAERAEEV